MAYSQRKLIPSCPSTRR